MITILYAEALKRESKSKPPATLTMRDFWILDRRQVGYSSNLVAYIYDNKFVLLLKNRWGNNGAIITLSEFIRNLAFNENWRGY